MSSVNYKLNYTKSPPDSRDYYLKTVNVSVKSLGTSIDLSQWCSPVEDQGSVGSCTAFATSGLMEFFYNKNTSSGTSPIFSEKFIYYATRVNVEGWPANEDSGCYLRDSLKCVNKYGSALHSQFPYILPGQIDCDYTQSPPPSVYTNALQYKVSQYLTVNSVNTQQGILNLKSMLANGTAFVGGIVCYSNFYNSVGGVIPMPSGQVIGGHAILFVGYDDAKSQFKFKNSWGTSWGDHGYGYLPYAYFTSGNVSEVWTVSQENFNGSLINVVVPSQKAVIFANRVNGVLSSITQTQDLPTLTTQIKSDPGNSQLAAADVNELVNLASRVVLAVSDAKKNSAKNK
jgi:C1A family cysteine protease